MNFAKYLKRNRLDEHKFAKLLREQFPHNARSIYEIRKWRNGSRRPNSQMILQLDHLTRGKVRLGDWLATERPVPKPRKTVDPAQIKRLLSKGTSILDIAKIMEINPATIYRMGFRRPNWGKQ